MERYGKTQENSKEHTRNPQEIHEKSTDRKSLKTKKNP